MPPIRQQECAAVGRTTTSSTILWKYLCLNLAIPNAIVNTLINIVIGLAFFWGHSEIGIYSGDQPIFPDIIISTFNSMFITHLVSIKRSSRGLASIDLGFLSAKQGIAVFFGSTDPLWHRIRGGIILALLWSLTAATITFIICTAFDVRKAGFGDVMTIKGVMAFSIGYIQSIISGYSNARRRTFDLTPEY